MNNTVSTHEELYATVPMSTIRVPSSIESHDEEVYTSFEQALSARLTMYGYRVRSTDSMLMQYHSQRQTEPIVRGSLSSQAKMLSRRARARKTTAIGNKGRHTLRPDTKRNVLLICFALMCTLAGFDLMGLLILHMR